MKLTDVVTQKIIRLVMNHQDYRVEVLALINAEFMQYAIDFFGRVVTAKFKNVDVTVDWYKAEFLDVALPSDQLIINAGLNKKTISNSHKSTRREIILEVTLEHYEQLYKAIQLLSSQASDLDFSLTIKFRGVSVELTLAESLIVINSLAAKHAQIRGGAWSTAGKQVEKPLMVTLCHLFGVKEGHYILRGLSDQKREIDFFLVDSNGAKYRCEVKLMGNGNSESADAVIARDSHVFIADKLSDLNKIQLTQRNVHWIELNSPQGYRKFLSVLNTLRIPAHDFDGDLNIHLDRILSQLFPE